MDLIMVEDDLKTDLCIKDKSKGEDKVTIVKTVADMEYSPPIFKLEGKPIIVEYCINRCYRYIYFTEYVEGFDDYQNLEKEVMAMDAPDNILMAKQLMRVLELVNLMSYNLNEAGIKHSDLHYGNVIVRKDALKSKVTINDIYIIDWELAIIDNPDNVKTIKPKDSGDKGKDNFELFSLDMMMKPWIDTSKDKLDKIIIKSE
jgi:hypothetical protein